VQRAEMQKDSGDPKVLFGPTLPPCTVCCQFDRLH
jgi:hypothetical protein